MLWILYYNLFLSPNHPMHVHGRMELRSAKTYLIDVGFHLGKLPDAPIIPKLCAIRQFRTEASEYNHNEHFHALSTPPSA